MRRHSFSVLQMASIILAFQKILWIQSRSSPFCLALVLYQLGFVCCASIEDVLGIKDDRDNGHAMVDS